MSEFNKQVQELLNNIDKEIKKSAAGEAPSEKLNTSIKYEGTLAAIKPSEIPLDYIFRDRNDNPILSIMSNGELYWREKKIEVEEELVAGLRDLLKNANV